MISIKVIQCELKDTKFGKPMKALTVEAENETRKVNMFSNFPNFANIKEGTVFEATMTKEGQYWNLSTEGLVSRPGGSGGFKTAQIEKVMDRKEHSIEKTLDRKEDSMRLMAVQRDAVLIVTQLMAKSDLVGNWDDYGEKIKKHVTEWRNWFLSDDFQAPPF